MAENPLRYSDLLQPDNSIENAITQLKELNQTYADTLKTVKSEAIRLKAGIEDVSGATEEHRKKITETTAQVDRLSKAQKDLEYAMSQNAKQLAELNIKKQEAQNVAKLSAKLNQSEAGSYNALSAQYALNKMQMEKLSKEYLENTEAGQKLVKQTEELYSQMKLLQQTTSGYGKKVTETVPPVDKLTKAQQDLEYAMSDEAKQLAELNIRKQEAQNVTKLMARLNQAEAGSYDALSAQYSLNKIQLNKLSQEYRENTTEGQKLVKETEEIYSKMKLLQQATGKYTLNVGNYKSAWDGLGVSAQQLVRELPSLAVSANTFFLAISNNIPMLVDEINNLKAANKAAAAEGQATVPVWKSVAKAFLSWNTLISLGVTLLTLYGGELVDWIGSLFKTEKSLDNVKEAMKGVNEAELKGRQDAQKSIVRLNLLYRATQDVSKSYNERKAAVKELKKEFPSYFKNISDEKILAGEAAAEYNKLAKAIIASAMARAAEEEMIKNSKEILKLEAEITKAYQEQDKALNKLKKAEASVPDVVYGGESGAELQRNALNNVKQAQKEVDAYGKKADDARAKIYALNKANTELAGRINVEDLTFEPKPKVKKQPKDRTLQDNKRNLDITKELYKSETDLITDELQKQRQALLDAYKNETDDLMNKYKNDKTLTQQSRDAILKIIQNKQQKLNQDLANLDAQAQQQSLDNERETLQLRLDAVESGTEEENALKIRLLENARKKELLENSRLVESQKQDEALINAKYDREILKQDNTFQQERSMLVFDQQQALAQSEFDLLESTEEEKTRYRLQAEKERLQKVLELNQTAAKKLSKEEIATIQNQIKKIDKEIGQTYDTGNRDIYDIIGLKLDDDQKQAISESVGFSIQQLQSILDSQLQIKEQALQAAQEETQAAQSKLDAEIEARNNGYANDVETAQKELELAKDKEAKALQAKQKAQRQQQALDTLTQTSSLITASAEIWKSLSGIPIVGIGLALAGIATMWASFTAAKIKAREATKTEYGEGGMEFLEGGSHQSGNDIDLGTTPDGRQRRAEGGEAFAIINKASTRKYRRSLPAIIRSLNNGTFEQKYMGAFTSEGLNISIAGTTFSSKRLEEDVREIKEQGKIRTSIDSKGRTIHRYKNLTRIIK